MGSHEALNKASDKVWLLLDIRSLCLTRTHCCKGFDVNDPMHSKYGRTLTSDTPASGVLVRHSLYSHSDTYISGTDT